MWLGKLQDSSLELECSVMAVQFNENWIKMAVVEFSVSELAAERSKSLSTST